MKKIGDEGETIAKKFLEDKMYEILETNYRASYAEIDIIAQKDNLLIFIEVKTRAYTSFGRPEEFVSSKKQNLLSFAANRYMETKNYEGEIRFDIIAIIYQHGSLKSINHYKDAFFPGL